MSILLLLLGIISILPKPITSSWIVVPNTTNAHWFPIAEQHITCPSKIFLPCSGQDDNHIPISFTRPFSGISTKVKGIPCHKLSYQTSCIWGVLTDDVTHTISNAHMKPQECIAAVSDWLTGERTVPPPYPEKVCGSWNIKTSVSNFAIYINEHDVIFDPYSNKLIDPTFPGGEAIRPPKLTPINTIHDGILWVGVEDPDTERCSLGSSKGFAFSASWRRGMSEEDFKSIKFWGPDFQEKSLVESCVLKLCGVIGFRFKDGTWGSIIPTRAEDLYIRELMNKFVGPCSPGTIIWTMTPNAKMAWEQEVIEKILLQSRCLETLTKIATDQHISPIDLSHLAQTFPGEDPAYLFRNRSLFQAVVPYLMINNTNTRPYSDVLGYLENGEEVVNTEWTEIDKVMYGPNGIIKKDGRILFSLDTLTGSAIDWSLLHPTMLHEVKEPGLAMEIYNNVDGSVRYSQGVGSNGSWIEKIGKYANNMGDNIGSGISSSFSKITTWIIIGVSVIVTIGLLKLIIRLVISKKTKKRQTDIVLKEIQIPSGDKSW